MDAIQLQQINKFYGEGNAKQHVLHNVDLSIEANSFNAIIGQSGSGKSTILNLMGTLDKADSGTIKINGRDISNMSKNELAKLRNQEIGFIFQFHYLMPEFTVLENVLMPYRVNHRKVPAERVEFAKHLLKEVGLIDMMDKNAANLSGGQAQRAAIARALINNPSIILADEPTGNLDSVATKAVYSLLRGLNEEFGTTFVVITHNQEVAQQADRIIEIKDGQVITDSTHPEIQFTYNPSLHTAPGQKTAKTSSLQ